MARRVPRIVGTLVLVLIALSVISGVAGTIGTGNVGVRTTPGVISSDEIGPGVYLKWPVISSVEEYSAKEIAIDLDDLTPKAKDNLSLRDFDVTVYYRVKDAAIAELQAKYAGHAARGQSGAAQVRGEGQHQHGGHPGGHQHRADAQRRARREMNPARPMPSA